MPMHTALAAAAVKVMIVGTFHMSNPGHDLHNTKVDDVLAAPRQTEIEAIVSSLARFQTTHGDVECPADLVNERYPKYLAGTLPPSRNEVVQLGFRLAKSAGNPIDGIDVDGDFPYEDLDKYAKAHGQSALLDAQHAIVEADMQKLQRTLADGGISAALRLLNE